MVETQTRPSNSATLETLQSEGADLISWWHSVEESKTEILKRLAAVVVEVRSKFWDEETGQPDWRGKTWEYRQFMTAMYEKAGVPPASVSGVQSSLRYHVGNQLREVVGEKELSQAGLLSESPKDRMDRQRTEAEALWRALNDDAISHDIADRRKAYRMLLDAVERLTDRLDTIPVDTLTKREAQVSYKHVQNMVEHWSSIQRELEGRIK